MEGKLENLIPISITEESDVLISARDLHDFLEIKTNFRIWYPRMIDYGFVEKEDYQKVYEKTNTLGGQQTVVDYMMNVDMAKEIAVIQRSEKGREARTYFIKVEKKFKAAQVALRSLLEITENNFKNSTTFPAYNNELNFNNEKVYKVEEKPGNLKTNFRDTSKLYGIRENLFVNWLLLNNYCYRDKKGIIKPYAKVMEYFYLKEFTTENGHSGMQTLINPKGREFFRNLLIDEKIIKEEIKLLEWGG